MRKKVQTIKKRIDKHIIAQTTPSMLQTVQAGKTWATVNQVDLNLLKC